MSLTQERWETRLGEWNAVEPPKAPDSPAPLFDAAMEGVDKTGPGELRMTQVSTRAGHLMVSHTPVAVTAEIGPDVYIG
jgi:hypothetical protein